MSYFGPSAYGFGGGDVSASPMRKSGPMQLAAQAPQSTLPQGQAQFSSSTDPFAINFTPNQDAGFAQQMAGRDPIGELLRSDPNLIGLASQIGYGSNLFQGNDPLANMTASQGADMFRRLSQFSADPNFRSTFFGNFAMNGMQDRGQQSAAEAMQSAYNDFLNRFRRTGQFGLSGSYTQGGF